MSIITKIKPWSPKKLSGCALYLDSSMGITLSSGYVSQWADQSGNGRHASQSTASYRPEYVIDPKTNTWSGALSPSGTPPSARHTHTAIVYGNYMYVFGGYDGSTPLNDLHRLNLDTLTWSGALSPSGTPPSARRGHTAIVYGNYMYVFGGYDGSSLFNDLHRLNLDTLTWSGALSPSGTPPAVRAYHTAVIYANYMYVFDGYTGSSNYDDLHRTDLSTVASVFKGRAALRFDGSDDYFIFNASGMPSGSSPRTAITVIKRTDTSKRGDLFSYRDTDTLYHAWGLTLDASALGDNDLFGNYWGVSIGQAGIADANPMIISTTLPSTNVYSTRLWKNGTELTYAYHGSGDGTVATGTSQASIGVTTGLISDTAFKGDILFLAIYNRVLSDAERQKVERWLGARYGITVA